MRRLQLRCRSGHFVTAPFQFAGTAAAVLLSTGFRPVYSPVCGQQAIRMLLRAALFRLAAGQDRKPGPCGLRPVPCLHFSPTAA
ncbi:hypothetical protein EPK90_22610 (plasmid) [Pantoea ananatis]|nr:hypothetical protein EPK90_22610 [Pantoea ananatis]